MRKYFVRYTVRRITGDKEHEAGPYDTYDRAFTESHDIAGYEGVSDVQIRSVEED